MSPVKWMPSGRRADAGGGTRRRGRVLLATDASATAESAVAVARALAERDAMPVDVISVVPPPAVGIGELTDLGLVQPMHRSDAEECRVREGCVRAQLARHGVEAWPITTCSGSPEDEIARAAHARGATLIVAGIGRHHPIDRLLGSEMTLRIVRAATVPVLATAEGAVAAPTRAVAGLDFSRSSMRAATAAARLLGPDHSIQLVHVPPIGQLPGVDDASWRARYERAARRRLDTIARGVHRATGVHVAGTICYGDPAAELLTMAEEMDADLIAIGAQHHGRVERILLGTVTTKILRAARCSVLVTPPVRERIRTSRPPSTRARAGVSAH